MTWWHCNLKKTKFFLSVFARSYTFSRCVDRGENDLLRLRGFGRRGLFDAGNQQLRCFARDLAIALADRAQGCRQK